MTDARPRMATQHNASLRNAVPRAAALLNSSQGNAMPSPTFSRSTRLADEMAMLREAMIRNVRKGDTPRGLFEASHALIHAKGEALSNNLKNEAA